jgi:serine/threonine-protein kinase
MADVFVSYKAEDRRKIKPLVRALEAEGFSVWWDEQIGGGAAWRHAIEAELNAAKSVVVIWTRRSVGPDGTFVQDEATRAQERHVYIPVTMEKVHLPLGFGETQALSLTGWQGDVDDPRYQAVCSAISGLVGRDVKARDPEQRRQKGISRRTAIAAGGVAAASVAAGGLWALLKPGPAEASNSIAVLPFANLSGDPAQAYFSDGIAEELRSALARFAGLKVVGRTSSEAVRADDAQTAARKLEVSNILTGSVRQSPATIRIGAQLIDGRTGIERWSENYDRQPGDTIKIQTDIAENVARALSITFGAAANAGAAAGGTDNADAQRLVLQAVEVSRLGDKDGLRKAIGLATAAIQADRKYADAYSYKALFTIWYASVFASDVPELVQMRESALEIARTALRLAPESAVAHRAAAEVHRVMLNLGDAQREYHRALELSPNSGEVMADYAFLVGVSGNAPEAVRLVDRAIDLDPLNIGPYATKFFVLVGARRFDEAVSFAQGLESTKPHLFNWPEGVAYALICEGKYDAAKAYQQRAAADSYNRLVNEAVIMARTGRSSEVPAIVAKVRSLYGDAASYQYGQIYAQLGDRDAAFAALDRAWEIRDAGLLRVKTDPYMEPLQGDPRMAAIIKKLNFPV